MVRARTQILPFFLVHNAQVTPLDDYPSWSASVPPHDQTIAFIDPCADPTNPGWPLRNLLAYLRKLYPDTTARLRILCWRDLELPPDGHWKSRFGILTSDPQPTTRLSAVGWEKNPRGQLGPRLADLAPMMDPTRLADQAVDLNLKLMRWRILPSLNLDSIAATKCLLLGAGTLGCYVARTLMAWGIRTITLVDSGRVSFSNPVRQPLFEFQDCLNGGKPKAECAAARLHSIFPGVVRCFLSKISILLIFKNVRTPQVIPLPFPCLVIQFPIIPLLSKKHKQTWPSWNSSSTNTMPSSFSWILERAGGFPPSLVPPKTRSGLPLFHPSSFFIHPPFISFSDCP